MLRKQLKNLFFFKKKLRSFKVDQDTKSKYSIFADCYRVFPNNLIVRHRDLRIMRMSVAGQPIVNRDFQYAYFHLQIDHVARKYPAFAQRPVLFATPDVCQHFTVDPLYRNMFNALDVLVQPTPVQNLINIMNWKHICLLIWIVFCKVLL